MAKSIHVYDDHMDEMLGRGGTFDLTGTNAKTNMQFFGFTPLTDTVIDTIKGVPLKTKAATLALITASEVDISSYVVTSLAATIPSSGSPFYRVDGYIITNVKLTSGSLHLYKIMDQVTS